MIPLWVTAAYTALALVVIVTWLRHYPPSNFLWFSDVALIGLLPALWLEQAWLASLLAVLTLVPELMWNLDYALRLALRRRIFGLTEYMFDAQRPLRLRALSLFHVPLPPLLIWAVADFGYVPSVLPVAIALAAALLLLSRWLGSERQNINWSHRLGEAPSRWPAAAHLGFVWTGMTLLFFLPTHWLLDRCFG